jgi:hypothetical protein
MIKPLLTLAKITHRPSFDPYLWHCWLGHVSEHVIHKYLQEHYPQKLPGKNGSPSFATNALFPKHLIRKPQVLTPYSWETIHLTCWSQTLPAPFQWTYMGTNICWPCKTKAGPRGLGRDFWASRSPHPN